MWKHKTKWLVRGGRKVRCYLCGKKILAKGDLFLFHGDTGYYSHQSCQAESTTISGNERRRAVKKIAVGAAVVGAIAAGAGKFLDVSSQSKNSPAAQTILTSQGLIPPALTSDPANPVPGQMWYRSDAGVEAHFDGVQNRVVYSSEINDGNVHVTSKGIINGLSVLPNDGTGWFGPDTTEGATAPGQYGSPYTQSTGTQEALTRVNMNGGGEIYVQKGFYPISVPLTYNTPTIYRPGDTTPTVIPPIAIIGEGSPQDTQNKSSASGSVIIYPTSGFSSGSNILTIGANLSDNYAVGGAIVKNIVFQCTENGQFAGQGDYSYNWASGLLVNAADQAYIFNNYVFGANGNGIEVAQGPQPSGLGGADIVMFNNVVNSSQNSIVVNGGDNTVAFNQVFFGGNNTSDYAAYLIGNTGSSTGPGINVIGNHANAIQCAFMIISGNALVSGNYLDGSAPMPGGSTPFDVSAGTVTIMDNYIMPSTGIVGSSTSNAILTVHGGSIYCKNNTVTLQGDILGWVQVLSDAAYVYFTDNNVISNGYTIYNDIYIASGVTLTNSIFEHNTIDGVPYFPVPTLSANPPVTATVYQNTNPYDIRLKIPVTYSPTSSAAATLATGTSSSSTVTTSTKVSYPAGITTGIIETYEMVVKAGQYFELVVTNATIGTVEVQAA